jgi:RecB family exonuclease
VAETIAADLRRYLEYESACRCGWEPRWLELRFGFEDEDEDGKPVGDEVVDRPPALPPLVLGEPGDQVTVRGVIDRVDVDPSGRLAAVRDYKSGSARPEHQGGRWRPDRQLQVALYMVAVRRLLGLEPVAGLYQPLAGKDLRPRGVFLQEAPVQKGLIRTDARDAESLRAELEDACARAVQLARALRAGELAPTPQTCSRDGCRYPGICRA